MNPSPTEKLAAQVVRLIMPEVTVIFAEQQNKGEPDYLIRDQAGEEFPLEVTAAVDQEYKETKAAIYGRKSGSDRSKVRLEGCTEAWFVVPKSGARIDQIRDKLPTLLLELEQQGLQRYHHADLARDRRELRRQFLRVGIARASHSSHPDKGFAVLASPDQGGVVSAASVMKVVLREASKPDNLRKLERGDQGHLFVFVHQSTGAPWLAMNDCLPPPVVPDMPQQLTDLWILAQSTWGGEYVLWKANKGTGWSEPRLLTISEETNQKG